MQSDLSSHDHMEKMGIFLKNRALFPLDELSQYAGQWIAWRPDGARIVAHASHPEAIYELVRAAGEDPEKCLVLGIPEEDTIIGGGLGSSGIYRFGRDDPFHLSVGSAFAIALSSRSISSGPEDHISLMVPSTPDRMIPSSRRTWPIVSGST